MKAKGLTKKEFILKAREIHGDKYGYSCIPKAIARVGNTVKIVCPKHGRFSQVASSHLRGRGCIKCYHSSRAKDLTKKEFISKAREVHGDKYDYSLVQSYLPKLEDKVEVICPKHGPFHVKIEAHLRGQRCKQCFIDTRRLKPKDFVAKAREVHGDKYDYSEVLKLEFVHGTISIICPKHGVFKQSVGNHNTNGHGCPKCGKEKFSERLKVNSSRVIKCKTWWKKHYANPEGWYCIDCGKDIKEGTKRCKSCRAARLKIRTTCPDCGGYKEKNTCACPKCIKKRRSGENNGNWKGGSSKEKYPERWARAKIKVLERDNYTCQLCGKKPKKHLDVHHIDYYKWNCKKSNLVTLCRSCHSYTGGNRDFWEWFLSEEVIVPEWQFSDRCLKFKDLIKNCRNPRYSVKRFEYKIWYFERKHKRGVL